MLLEKAFAKLHGSYESIGTGGSTADTLNYLTAGLVSTIPMPQSAADGPLSEGEEELDAHTQAHLSPWQKLLQLCPIEKPDLAACVTTASSPSSPSPSPSCLWSG